ncbi:Orn/Lys/Arg decarboxylase N-terminal domain-containing protein [uncultured Thalassospira sp.]|uniref:Orn/Lys/Arg family decarboxylase n=1 Tax=uncultured Thalassospira sp. TaxID=404382 RepID=UPI0030DD12AB|tara:strand:- start:13011 stop:15344 length:2334 start_codon:yes stop_codon:yes gene_type:complete
MSFYDLFKFLVVEPERRDHDIQNSALSEILSEIKKLGPDVVRTASIKEAEIQLARDVNFGCFLITGQTAKEITRLNSFLDQLAIMGLSPPVFVLASQLGKSELDPGLIERVRGVIYLEEDTPDFIAKFVTRHFHDYANQHKTPFFGKVLDYAEAGNEVWTCPGHEGGMFYRKSPVGRVFFDYMGEAIFRTDLDNSVVELGDLLIHEGPALEAQKQAAEIFGADRTYFVLNGTSTSNKIATGALISPGDLVLFDRNNHKSQHHGALMMAGGIPVYIPTIRNSYGLIGPMDMAALEEDELRQRLKDHPLVKDPDAWKRERPFRLAILENCSYDGTIYDVRQIIEKIGKLCDYILFDEAWAGFMKFHPLFKDHFAMGLENLGDDAPGLIATQSTHKQLAGFSQASQIHIKDNHIQNQKRLVAHRRFNEVFMMHASTSPFYPLFASLDVGAQMMKGANGTYLWDQAIRTAIEIRKKIRFYKRRYEADGGWFFDPFVPDQISISDTPGEQHAWEDVETSELARNPAAWALAPNAKWHGFGDMDNGLAMTDPNKLTLLMPGFDRETGDFAPLGIPAPLLAQFLRERGIVCEKNDIYSILFLVTPAIERSKAGTLLSALCEFKKLFDEDAPLAKMMPAKVKAYPDRYGTVSIQMLAKEMHAFFKQHKLPSLQRNQFELSHFPELALTPQKAHAALIANEVDYIPVSELETRIAATLTVVYPPGIGVMVPGERYSKHARPQLDYFRMFEENDNLFPGFEYEIQGIYKEHDNKGRVVYHTYVVREA